VRLCQFSARNAANGRPLGETITGDGIDTSEYMDFDFYGLVRYKDRAGGDKPPKIGR